jgi:serine/threonine-protein kinase
MSKKSKNKTTYSAGDILGEWTLVELLGAGGNGDVWMASKNDEKYAIKLLRSVNSETYSRFKIETDILSKLDHIDGIIPLIDKFLPDEPTKEKPWFVMPLALPFEEYIKNKEPVGIIEDFIQLAKTIELLHENKISHRDIKPANFLYYENRLCLSDFGLVKYPTRTKNLTQAKRDVGAKFTMAPEMRRFASQSNGLSADVYSFAKSLWIALTRKELGFDGQYTIGSSIALSNYSIDLHIQSLDQLLIECTDNDPKKRPPISIVVTCLQECLKITQNFHVKTLAEWAELTKKLFPISLPSQCIWTDIDSICNVISEITKPLNYLFLPDGGGMAITSVSKAAEPGMIALCVDSIAYIIKPRKLTYESFGDDTSWSYFRLEASMVDPLKVDNSIDPHGFRQKLTEIVPGEYVSHSHWDNSDYHRQPLPSSARSASRYLKGAFVFFSTRSVYNLITSTDDARHDKMSEDKFREYIEKSKKKLDEYEKKHEIENILEKM